MQQSAVHQPSLDSRQRGDLVCDNLLATLGQKELVELQRTLLEELWTAKESVEREVGIDDTHRLLWLHLPPFYSSRLMDFIELTCNAPVVFEEVNFVGWRNWTRRTRIAAWRGSC